MWYLVPWYTVVVALVATFLALAVYSYLPNGDDDAVRHDCRKTHSRQPHGRCRRRHAHAIPAQQCTRIARASE